MPQRRWRDYRTASGRRPIKDFTNSLTDADTATVVAAMNEVKREGLSAARHVSGEIYEVRADGDRQIFCILFAKEGHFGQVLLSLDGFSKKSRKTPPDRIALAKRRLREWRSR